MILALSLLILVLAGFDAWLSARRIREHGLGVERNRSIRWLTKLIGPEFAAYTAILIPTTGLIGILVLLKWVVPLALLAGFRLYMFWIQLQSIELEARIRAIKNKLGS